MKLFVQIPGVVEPSPLVGGEARRPRGLRSGVLALAGLALLCLAVLLPGPRPGWAAGLRLELVETGSGRVAWSTPVKAGEPFTLWFLHSYDRAFFAEHYQVAGPGKILLTHMTFKSNLNGEGFEYTDFNLRPDGVGELRNINEPRSEVHFMMGSPDMANHTVILRGQRTALVKFVKPGTLVSLIVSKGDRPAGK